MRTLDVNKLHIIAREYEANGGCQRIYVVNKTPDNIYIDPLCVPVDIAESHVGSLQHYNQFMKFCCPIPMDLDEEVIKLMKSEFYRFPVKEQRKLIQLYDPDIFSKSTPILGEEVYDYVTSRLLLPLSVGEFKQIENGFRLRWNYSCGQFAGDGDFKRATDQYLTAIEFQIDRRKMNKVVDLILEYLEWIGQWGWNPK